MMLTQFRRHYPQGSLISELLTIDHGKYIVRVVVQVEGMIVGTGLAADATLELAEDRARERALMSLDLDRQPVGFSKTAVIPEKQPITAKSNVVESVKLSSVSPDTQSDPVPQFKEKDTTPPETKSPIETFSPSKKSSSKSSKKSSNTVHSKETVSQKNEDQSLPFAEISPEPDIDQTPLTTEDQSLPFAETPPEPEVSEKPPIIEEETLDFSDIIARSNAELKRLGWTTEQGREYLIQTYGKRSRQVLSDEELLEFLRYLESLPTPS